jgi:hypothetical protein
MDLILFLGDIRPEMEPPAGINGIGTCCSSPSDDRSSVRDLLRCFTVSLGTFECVLLTFPDSAVGMRDNGAAKQPSDSLTFSASRWVRPSSSMTGTRRLAGVEPPLSTEVIGAQFIGAQSMTEGASIAEAEFSPPQGGLLDRPINATWKEQNGISHQARHGGYAARGVTQQRWSRFLCMHVVTPTLHVPIFFVGSALVHCCSCV